MNNAKLFLTAIIFLSLTFSAFPQQEKVFEQEEEFDIRSDNFPPQRPKSEVFPLGYPANGGTNTLGKVTTGTGVWTELNPNVPRVDYYGLDFINPDTGWACGNSGAIIKTTNGGEDWSIGNTPDNSFLFKIHSYNGQVVVAVGPYKKIFRSDDGGDNFDEINTGLPGDTHLWGVQMVNDTLGWVCGANQTLLKTIDGGLNWQLVSTGFPQYYRALEFLNEQLGYVACDGGKVLKTTDGGTNWTQIQAGDSKALYTVEVIDELHVTVAGEDGKNLYSSDAGVSWITNTSLGGMGDDINWIEFIDRDTGYVVQFTFKLWKTTDRGQSWFNPNSIRLGGEYQVELLDDGTGYMGGEDLNIYKRTDGLDNWQKLFFTAMFSDVFFLTETKGFFITTNPSGGVYKTDDGGETLRKIPDSPIRADLLFLDSLTGFAGGNNKTTDGGETWYNTNGGGNTKVFFINNTTGWSIDASHIYKTTDTGENWTEQPQPGASNNRSIFFIDSLNGWVASQFIWQTTNGGDTWIKRDDIPVTYSTDVYFYEPDTGWIARNSTINNSFFRTTDAGVTWTAIPEIRGAYSIYSFPDKNHLLITGVILESYVIYKKYISYDGGNSWIDISEEIKVGFSGFSPVTNHIAYAVGSLGLILKYNDTTYIPVELITFNGKYENGSVHLYWQTATELNNSGFEVQRSNNKNEWEKIGFVTGTGNSTEVISYQFSDNDLTSKKNYYRLKQVDYDGSFSYSDIVEINITVESFSLSQNYPNPFNPVTMIRYEIPVQDRNDNLSVSLKVYDVLGKEVAVLVDEFKPAGNYEVEFPCHSCESRNLPSGIYFYQFKAGNLTETKKMLLLK